MFRSSSSKGEFVSLAEYVERMKEKQQAIYYIAGGSLDEVYASILILLLKSFLICY